VPSGGGTLLRLIKASALVVICATFLSGSAFAESEPEIPWDKIKDSAERYLEKCVAKSERDAMARKMEQHIKQRVADTGVDADQAAREIMFDWAASNRGSLKKKDPVAIAQVCYYFVSFMEKGFLISSKIRESLTPSLVTKIVNYLEEQIKQKQ
jgi:hypothetical protein